VIEVNGSCSAKIMRLVKRTLYVAFASLVSFGGLSGLVMLGSSAARADVVLDEARFVQRMNADRAAAGVPPLLVVPRLIEIARAWSRVLSDRSTSQTECTLSHNQNLLEVLRPASKVAENVGCGDGTADALHDAFMNSPHHRANILDPSFDSVGVGVFMNGETMFVSVEFIRTVVVPAPMVTLSPLPPLIPVPATVPSEKLASPAASRATAGNSKTASAPRPSAPRPSAPAPKVPVSKVPSPKVPAPKVVLKRISYVAPRSLSNLSNLSNLRVSVAKRGTVLALRRR
jgi:Cysteine-rich secretory protein family